MKTKRQRRTWTKRDWTPVAQGDAYCSPACGSSCTRAAYERANAEAAALAQRLGPRFVPRVWENMGWHWAAWTRCKRICVHPPHGAGETCPFSAFINVNSGPGGEFVGHGGSPETAIRDAFRQAAERRDQLNSLLAVAERCKIRL